MNNFKQTLKLFGKLILPVLIFIVMQTLCSAIMLTRIAVNDPELQESMLNGDEEAALELTSRITPSMLAVTVLVSGLATALLLRILKYWKIRQAFNPKNLAFKFVILSFIGAAAGIFSTNILSEQMALEDTMGATFQDMSSTLLGFICIGVVGPICEEIVFRQALMGTMLRNGFRISTAITVSAMMFGFVHMNPAQIPFAFLMGIILGVIYCMTGNIVVTSIVHIANNSLAVWQMSMITEGQQPESLTYDVFGSRPVAYAVCMVGAIICIEILRRLWYQKL